MSGLNFSTLEPLTFEPLTFGWLVVGKRVLDFPFRFGLLLLLLLRFGLLLRSIVGLNLSCLGCLGECRWLLGAYVIAELRGGLG